MAVFLETELADAADLQPEQERDDEDQRGDLHDAAEVAVERMGKVFMPKPVDRRRQEAAGEDDDCEVEENFAEGRHVVRECDRGGCVNRAMMAG